ncbi:DUF2793 domain-containing protein [Brevundimonas sp.]|jgi:hypothetical protein|uniref:DUF2793 domain-containing protein n=1 Tax=Brevundimonas sp. TaxID=1871086 RepID=UPI0037C04275
MSDDFSARLALPYLAAGQMQKHVTLNAALTRLDALLQTAVVSRTTTTQPGDVSDGDLYILPDGAHGPAWDGRRPGDLMRFEAGGWTVAPAPVGMVALVLDTATAVVRGEGGWSPLGQWLGEVQALSRLGVGTTADAANPLAIKSNTALFTARGADEGGDGDLRLTLNKAAAGDVLSLLFQSGYAGRAELGLAGDENLSLKVSADGTTWRRAFGVDRASGRIDFDRGATRRETTVFTDDGVYEPPAWARWIETVCVGGGGGGGAGLAGPAGTTRFGGGGGGAGGLRRGAWATADLTGGLTIVIGSGGAASGAGGESRIEMSGVGLARAGGGAPGAAGTGGSGGGGGGGLGERLANGGGAASTTATSGGGGEAACPDGPGGGGAGGGLDTANAARAGGIGGTGDVCGRRTPGGAAGTAGQASSAPDLSCGGGGGGGGNASASGAGMAGGAGAAFGAGGGGGGAGLTAPGAGGIGGGGVVRITAVG